MAQVFEIKDIEKTANEIGIYKSETKNLNNNTITEAKTAMHLQLISQHIDELIKDQDDYEFHIASI